MRKKSVTGREAARRIALMFLSCHDNDPERTSTWVYDYFQNNSDARKFILEFEKETGREHFLEGLYYGVMLFLFGQTKESSDLTFTDWIKAHKFELVV